MKQTKMDIKSSLSCLEEALKDTGIDVNITSQGVFHVDWKSINLETDQSGAAKAIDAFKTLNTVSEWD